MLVFDALSCLVVVLRRCRCLLCVVCVCWLLLCGVSVSLCCVLLLVASCVLLSFGGGLRVLFFVVGGRWFAFVGC